MTTNPSATPLLKDQLGADYVARLITQLAQLAQTVHGHAWLDTTPLIQLQTAEHFLAAELMPRIHLIADALFHSIRLPLAEKMPYLAQLSAEFSGLQGLVFPTVIQRHGIAEPELAMRYLADVTPYSSAEFAIRPFLQQYPELVLPQLQQWALSENPHLRRLACEGARPRLPWGTRLRDYQRDPRPLLPILHQLSRDDSAYVRRSVANHLNDISKDHPALALEIATQWAGQHPHSDWIVRHGLRTLLKAAQPEALALLGYHASQVKATLLLDRDTVPWGQTLEFSCLFSHVTPQQPLRIEFVLHFASKTGLPRQKVFQWKRGQFSEPQFTLSRKYSFTARTTRTYYPGRHRLQVLVNGHRCAEAEFCLAPP